MLRADGQDLSFITVEALDAEGRFQPDADQEVQFAICGPGVIAAMGDGDGRDGASYQGNRRKLYQGRALVVVRTAKQEGSIHLTGMAAGLTEGVANIEAKKTDQRSELR